MITNIISYFSLNLLCTIIFYLVIVKNKEYQYVNKSITYWVLLLIGFPILLFSVTWTGLKYLSRKLNSLTQ